MKKVVTIIGARPQFIKAAAVSRAIIAHNATNSDPRFSIKEVVVHTGQHYDANMSDVFFAELGMERPAYHLDIHGGNHGEMTGRMLIEIEKVLLAETPDYLLVYGDTNSTLAGALAASKLHIPIAHVEAGLRSFNMKMPEEINRILTDRISNILFCPTETAVENLRREGFRLSDDPQSTSNDPLVVNTGDVMYDVARYYAEKVSADGGLLKELGLSPKEYVLATIHRAENTDHPERLNNIIAALIELSKELPVVLPLHPRTRKILESADSQSQIQNSKSFIMIDPVGYLDMVQLEKYAALIATDSGGVQKEAFFYQVPCVTLRDETEWVELVEAGWNRLAPPVSVESVLQTLCVAVATRGSDVQPYGGGTAANKIVDALIGLQSPFEQVRR